MKTNVAEMMISPSILASNQSCLGQEADRAERAGADRLHLDIMDGHFVPNLSFGPQVVKAIRPLTKLFFDIHLMCSKPEILLEAFATAGADEMIIHIELGEQVPSLIHQIKSLGKKVGLAVNPPTAIAAVQPFLEQIDLLLVMTVNPGFGGQEFIPQCLPKIQQASVWRHEQDLSYRISVDGGINDQTAAECARVGADTFVAGTSLFGARSLATAIGKMRQIANENSLAIAA
jgi:ribulose-phosphate 3-epimerase